MKKTKTFKYEEVAGFAFGSWPFGQPKLFSHVYFVDGLLLDTGHRNMRKDILATLGRLEVNQIFISHHHEDHTGNLQVLQQHFKCPTYSSAACIELMKAPPRISFAQWLTWGNRGANFQLEEKEGRVVTTNYQFDIIPIPGHAIDMVALHEAEKGWLFSADLWVYKYIRYFMRAESMYQQIESIKRVLQLDFDVLFCSHNPQLSGGKQKLREKLQFLEDFYGRAADFYHKGYSPAAILKAMGLKEDIGIQLLSTGELSTINMVRSVVRDEKSKMD